VPTPYGIQNRNFCGLLSLYGLTKCVNYLLCTANERSLIITNTIVHSTNVYSKFIKRNRTNKCTYRYVNLVYIVACYTFRPPIVVIFRKEFFDGILHRTLKQFANIKCQVSGKSLKSMLKYKILIKLFVLSCVLMCSVWYMVTPPQVVLLLCLLVPLCNPKSVVMFPLTSTSGHYMHKPCTWARNAIRGGAPNSVLLPPIHDVFAATAAVRMTTILKQSLFRSLKMHATVLT
jgi:hypothetical protein